MMGVLNMVIAYATYAVVKTLIPVSVIGVKPDITASACAAAGTANKVCG
ncbi:hypothetical protein MAMMFC1_00653 [Methylomusa anaerophila]|uniref:Uncharacterized protein n=2 Tax=Methylomusa anaerophila TaxID=1930071 RepID=A0A348AG11_9FIRM|nr:hypothetical protein MAMMFC1_00653 [Methylomusa anaerophila]